MATPNRLSKMTVPEFKQLYQQHRGDVAKIATARDVTPSAVYRWMQRNKCNPTKVLECAEE